MASQKDKQGYLLIAAMVILLAIFFGYKLSQDNKQKPLADNCIGTVKANTVIVLDHSEKISKQTRTEIEARAINYILDKVQPNERVSVFTVSNLSKLALVPVVSRCRPPDEGNRLVEDTRRLHKRFIESFEKPLREALSAEPTASSESPIAQALTDISLSQYLRGEKNTLLVFSDMLENTTKFTLYRCPTAVSVVSRFRDSRKGAQERPTFKNTNVVLNLIPSLGHSKEVLSCRTQLWNWFFGDNEGSNASVAFDFLPGGTLDGTLAVGVKK
jgi:hypothetical protein